MGKNSVPPHSFSPPYRWGKTVYPSLFFPTLQMERKSELHSFSPSVRWKFESVPHTLFSHCNKMGKKSVLPTLFFPIIEGEKVQRVKVYPYPRKSCVLCGKLLHVLTKFNPLLPIANCYVTPKYCLLATRCHTLWSTSLSFVCRRHPTIVLRRPSPMLSQTSSARSPP